MCVGGTGKGCGPNSEDGEGEGGESEEEEEGEGEGEEKRGGGDSSKDRKRRRVGKRKKASDLLLYTVKLKGTRHSCWKYMYEYTMDSLIWNTLHIVQIHP